MPAASPRLAFVVFDDMTALDFLGAYDALVRLDTLDLVPGLAAEVVATTATVRDGYGIAYGVHRSGESLADYDAVVVPGGFGTRALADDEDFLDWLRTASPVPLVASVCTGSLLLGAAGLLDGRAATTHPAAYDLLAKYTDDVRRERIVDSGGLVTAGGVTASIDLGLHLCERLAGAEARARVAEQMDYPYRAASPVGAAC